MVTADGGGSSNGYRTPVVSLSANTTTASGLKIKAALDTRAYDTAVAVSDDEFATINLKPSRFHGGWNYVIG
ncbi:MAG: hypothetical protein RL685_3628 [Pseudomonadota bacterium]|jgi:hypothetical protein